MDTTNETSEVQIEEEQAFNEAYADIEAALSDVDPDNRSALNTRVFQVLDDIHAGRL